MAKKNANGIRELAFYYPNPMWTRGDWIKNLVLFFDGIALLVPGYLKRRPEEIDPAIVSGLRKHHLLQIVKPEKAVNKAATEKLVMALTDVIGKHSIPRIIYVEARLPRGSRPRHYDLRGTEEAWARQGQRG
jgi:hypothetical protein